MTSTENIYLTSFRSTFILFQCFPLFFPLFCCRKLREKLKKVIKESLRENCPYSEFFLPVFFCIRVEYGEVRSISPYSARMRENTDQKNSAYEHFSRSECRMPESLATNWNNDLKFIEKYLRFRVPSHVSWIKIIAGPDFIPE